MRRRTRDLEFEALFLAHYDAIVASVSYMCGSRERAADATQEAFIKAYARWSRIRHYDSPAAWVHRAAINLTRDAHRSETRRRRREQTVAQGQSVAPTDVDRSPLDLLAGLPERQRAIAALYYVDDLSVAEIGRVLGIAEGTVRFHLSEARRRLREQHENGSVGHVG